MKIKLLHKNKEQAKTENVKADNISEIEKNVFCNPLMEMARVDNPKKDSEILGTKEIWVYAADKPKMPPHFHYKDVKGNVRFNLEIKIDPIKDLIICNSEKRNGVPENILRTWYGLSEAKKSLQDWLVSMNSHFTTYTNYDVLVFMWNSINPDNVINVDTNVLSFDE